MSGGIDIVTAAAKWASIGQYVFPYVAKAKVPFGGSHGHHDASDDPETVVRLFRHYIETTGQTAGIGVWTGASGISTIDCDNTTAGSEFRRIAGDAALKTLVMQTRRGWQFFYRVPKGIELPNGSSRLRGIEGLDHRSGSSWAALPPSKVKTLDGEYRFPGHDLEFAIANFWDLAIEMPESVLDLILNPGGGDPATGRGGERRKLRSLIDDGRLKIPTGARNEGLHAVSGYFRHIGMSEESILGALAAVNAHDCEEPLPEKELDGIAKSIATKEPGTLPGAAPPKLHRLDVAYMVEHDPPPVDWVLDGIAARSAVTMIHGDAGLGKSMFALAGAVAVTRGAPFMNHSTPRGRVLYIDAENGKGEAHRRIRALGLTAAEAGSLVYCEALGVDLRGDADELLSAAVDAEPDLVIADSLATLSRSDEDSSGETTLAIQVLQRIARETGAAVILLHHDKKDKTNFRGSSAIAAVVEIRWHLTKDADRENARRLVNEKCRLAAEAPERWIEIRQSERGIEVAQISKPPTSKEAEDWDSVVELLSDGRPRTNREIAVETGLASPGGGCPGSLARLLKEKRNAGYLVGGSAGGVTLAPHLMPTKNVEEPAKAPPPAAPRPDPLIPPPRDGSRDQPASGAFMPDPDIGEAA